MTIHDQVDHLKFMNSFLKAKFQFLKVKLKILKVKLKIFKMMKPNDRFVILLT